MVRIYTFMAVSVFGAALTAQSLVITFNGTLNDVATPLDSILVMNLSQGGDTSILFPDNELVLSAVGIGELAQRAQWPITVLPGPFAGSTDVHVQVWGGELLLRLHDASGRELITYAAKMAPGHHRFRASCERPGVHLLTVLQGDARQTIRLLATEGAGITSVAHIGTSDRDEPKDDRTLFTWTLGDELRYIGYATDAGIVYSAAVDEVPVATTTRTFDLLAGVVCPNTPALVDMDGHLYRAVQIGDQCWMAEDLRTGRYRDGTIIPHVSDDIAWSQLNGAAWCNFGNDPDNDAVYGKLYNWYAAANPLLCPQGWHVPSDAEWTVLTDHLGGMDIAGGKMKSPGTQHWAAPNMGATNESGFSALPGGDRFANNGVFYNLGHGGFWWSTSEDGEGNAWNRLLVYFNDGVNREHSNVRDGFCVRCVRD